LEIIFLIGWEVVYLSLTTYYYKHNKVSIYLFQYIILSFIIISAEVSHQSNESLIIIDKMYMEYVTYYYEDIKQPKTKIIYLVSE
jgi:hypothetical protein